MEEVTFVVIYSVRRYTCLPGNNRLRLVFYHQAATRRNIVLSVVTISAGGRVGREIRRGDAVCRFEYFHHNPSISCAAEGDSNHLTSVWWWSVLFVVLGTRSHPRYLLTTHNDIHHSSDSSLTPDILHLHRHVSVQDFTITCSLPWGMCEQELKPTKRGQSVRSHLVSMVHRIMGSIFCVHLISLVMDSSQQLILATHNHNMAGFRFSCRN